MKARQEVQSLAEPAGLPPARGVAGARPSAAILNVEQVYDQEADFVWRSLQRLGLPTHELDDVFQDVFEIVQRGLARFRGDGPLRSWLFGICVRQVKRQRRLRWFRREPVELAPLATTERTPEREAEQRERLALLNRALRSLTPEQHAVFTMCEVERLTGEEVAEVLGVPVGTIYSRLHSARKRFLAECAKLTRLGLLPERES